MSDVLSHLSATEASASQMPPPLMCQRGHCVLASLCCVAVSQYIEDKNSERTEIKQWLATVV